MRYTGMMKRILPFILIFFLTSCGDLFTEEAGSEPTSYEQFATCEMDTDAFSYIFEKNIKGEILCLEENLELFIDVIETDRPGYISKKSLKTFIEFGPQEIDLNVLNLVDSVFDLSHIILGTDKDYITKEKMHVLIDFLVYFNEHIWKSYKFFMSEDKVNYERHMRERSTIFNEFTLISDYLKNIFKDGGDDLDRIDLEELIFSFFNSDPENLEKARSLMFLKRVFLGGDRWELSQKEFKRLLELMPSIAEVAFDLVRVEYYEFTGEQEILIKVFLGDIDTIKQSLFYDADSYVSVFNIYDLINVFTIVAPDLLDFNVGDFPKEIMKIKEIILGNGLEIVTSKELIDALEHGENILKEGDLFYRVYSFYKEDLETPTPITLDFSDFPVNNSQEAKFLDNFARIAYDYKFFKGDFTSAYYSFDYYRNANAFFQTSAIEYLVKLVMKFYGNEHEDARLGYHMTLDETVNLVEDFKWFLKDQGIIKIGRVGGGEVANIADNFVLLSTLFQYQSNGCYSGGVCMETPEITEFAMGLFTALEVKDAFTDEMLELCEEELDSYDRIAPECFRRNFIKALEAPILEGGKAIVDFMPNLYVYLQELTSEIPSSDPITESESYMKFITETEAFTRTCMYYDDEKTDEVYLKGDDAFAVFAGLLNVETTMLRFDIDQNNLVDAYNSNGKNEAITAFNDVYKSAVVPLVEGIVGNEAAAKLLAKPVFQYLVKYGRVPGALDLGKFLFKRNKNANINRTTVSNILRVIGEESENAILFPFKCEECLRDPTIECEPEGGNWNY